MAAISQIIRWPSAHSVTPVALAGNSEATRERSKPLAVIPVAPNTPDKLSREAKPQRPAIWHIEVSGKLLIMIDFGLAQEAEIEPPPRAQCGSRLSTVELGKLRA